MATASGQQPLPTDRAHANAITACQQHPTFRPAFTMNFSYAFDIHDGRTMNTNEFLSIKLALQTRSVQEDYRFKDIREQLEQGKIDGFQAANAAKSRTDAYQAYFKRYSELQSEGKTPDLKDDLALLLGPPDGKSRSTSSTTR